MLYWYRKLYKEEGKVRMTIKDTVTECTRNLSRKWRISPSINVPPYKIIILADINGLDIIQLWMTCFLDFWRSFVLRFYWDRKENSSIEVPYSGPFWGNWCQCCEVNSLLING